MRNRPELGRPGSVSKFTCGQRVKPTRAVLLLQLRRCRLKRTRDYSFSACASRSTPRLSRSGSRDAKHQRKGYGAKTMRWVIDEARRLGVSSVGLSHQDLPGNAGPFYEKLGFRYTGKVEHNERLMVLGLEASRD